MSAPINLDARPVRLRLVSNLILTAAKHERLLLCEEKLAGSRQAQYGRTSEKHQKYS